MEMIIALDSSFREVQVWYKDHLIWDKQKWDFEFILSHAQIVKLNLNLM